MRSLSLSFRGENVAECREQRDPSRLTTTGAGQPKLRLRLELDRRPKGASFATRGSNVLRAFEC